MAEHLLDQVAGIAESAKKARPPSLPLVTLVCSPRERWLSPTTLFLILLTLSATTTPDIKTVPD